MLRTLLAAAACSVLICTLSSAQTTLSLIEPSEPLLPGDQVTMAATVTVHDAPASGYLRLRAVFQSPATGARASFEVTPAATSFLRQGAAPVTMPLTVAVTLPLLSQSCSAAGVCSMKLTLYADLLASLRVGEAPLRSSDPYNVPIQSAGGASISPSTFRLQSETQGVVVNAPGFAMDSKFKVSISKAVEFGRLEMGVSKACPPDTEASVKAREHIFFGFCDSGGPAGPATLHTYTSAGYGGADGRFYGNQTDAYRASLGSYNLLVQGTPASRPQAYTRGRITRTLTDIIVPAAVRFIDGSAADLVRTTRINAGGRQELTPGVLNFVPPADKTYGFIVEGEYVFASRGAGFVYAVVRPRDVPGAREVRGAPVYPTRGYALPVTGLVLPTFPALQSGDPHDLEIYFALVPDDVEPSTYDDSKAIAVGPVTTVTYADKPELTLHHIEAVQAVQTAANQVPLVARKGTVLRVFPQVIKSDRYVEGVTGTLRGFRNGVEETTYSPLRPFNAPMVAVKTPDRTSEFDSLHFLLPVEWTLEGDWEFAVTLQAPGIAAKEFRAPAVTFKAPPNWPNPFTVAYLPVCYQPPGQARPACPADSMPFRADSLQALYPVPDDGLRYAPLPVAPWLWKGEMKKGADAQAFVAALRVYYNLMADKVWVYDGQVDQLIAFFPDIPGFELLGTSDPVWLGGDGHVVFVRDRNPTDSWDASHRVAHEIGHNLTLRHPNPERDAAGNFLEDADGNPIPKTTACGAVDGSGFNKGLNGWPYDDGGINEVGFDPLTRTFIPWERFDVMTYCSPPGWHKWISPYSFTRLFNAYTSVVKPKSAPKARAAGPSETLLVTGFAEADGSGGSLQPGIRVASTLPFTASDASGDHCVRLLGDQGKIAETCFTLSFVDTEAVRMARNSFTVRMPYTAGIRRVALFRGEKELASMQAGSAAPSVKITSPVAGARLAGGPLGVQWTASDSDGDRLTFAVLYSADGGATFLPLVTGLTDQQYAIDGTFIDGGRQVYLRVLASDGINGTADTIGPIEVAQSPALSASATGLAFDNVLTGRTNQLTFTLNNTGNGPLRLKPLATDSPAFTVLSPKNAPLVPAGTGIPVTLRFRPDAAGERSATLTVAASDVPDLTIALSGKGVTEMRPEMKVSPASLSFGTVALSRSAEASLTVHNAGPGPLRIRSLSIGSAMFTVSSPAAPIVVAAYADQKIVVRFAPAESGAQTASLTIVSDDPGRLSVDVPLSGAGGAASAPSISASPTRLDFGSVQAGRSSSLALNVANGGDAPLTVNSIATDNAVFTVVSPAAPFTIAAGERREVAVRFSPAASGAQTANLAIASNDPGRATLTVPLNGTGTSAPAGAPAIEVTPLALDFGSVGLGQSRELNVAVANRGSADLEVNRVGVAGAFAVTTAMPLTVAAGSSRPVAVRFAPTDPGRRTGSLSIASNDTAKPLVTVELSATGTQADGPRIAIRPASLDFGSVAVGGSAERELTIANTGTSELAVTGISSSSAAFGVVKPVPPVFLVPAYGEQVVTIRFTPASAGAAAAVLTIASKDADRPAATIPLSGSGSGTASGVAAIAVSPSTLDFGNVMPDQKSDLSLTVSNTGSATLTVSAISSSNARYSVVSPALPFNVAAGGQGTVTVRFAPPVTGTQTGSLTISSNDPARASVSVGLRGNGYLMNVLFSDSFDRPNADACASGPADNAHGGTGNVYYLPVTGTYAGIRNLSMGPEIVNRGLQNPDRDYSGMQFTGGDPCQGSSASLLRQDLGMAMEVRAPGDVSGRVTQAGPFFRARAATPGDPIIGDNAGGYWVRLHSTGEVTIKRLDQDLVVASSGQPAEFDNAAIHTLEISLEGSALLVALDGKLVEFKQGGAMTVRPSIPDVGTNHGAFGVAFGAEGNRREIGGQRIDNLVVSNGRALSSLPIRPAR